MRERGRVTVFFILAEMKSCKVITVYMKLVTSYSPPDYLTTIMNGCPTLQPPQVENRKVYTSFVPVLSYNQSIEGFTLLAMRWVAVFPVKPFFTH